MGTLAEFLVIIGRLLLLLEHLHLMGNERVGLLLCGSLDLLHDGLLSILGWVMEEVSHHVPRAFAKCLVITGSLFLLLKHHGLLLQHLHILKFSLSLWFCNLSGYSMLSSTEEIGHPVVLRLSKFMVFLLLLEHLHLLRDERICLELRLRFRLIHDLNGAVAEEIRHLFVVALSQFVVVTVVDCGLLIHEGLDRFTTLLLAFLVGLIQSLLLLGKDVTEVGGLLILSEIALARLLTFCHVTSLLSDACCLGALCHF